MRNVAGRRGRPKEGARDRRAEATEEPKGLTKERTRITWMASQWLCKSATGMAVTVAGGTRRAGAAMGTHRRASRSEVHGKRAGSARQSRNTRGGGKSAKESSSTRRMRARLQGRVRLRVVSGCGSFSCGSGQVAGRIRWRVGSGGGSYQVAGRSVTLRVGSG